MVTSLSAGLLALSLVMAPAAWGAPRPAASGTTICHNGQKVVVGEDVALSGPNSFLGNNDVLGATAYFDQLNSKGGLDGCKFKIIQENNQSTPSLAASIVRKLVTEDHANFIFGPEETADTVAALPVENAMHVVSFMWSSGWNIAGTSYADNHGYGFPGIVDAFLNFDYTTITQLIVPRHYTRVALIEDNTPGGLENKAYMQQAAKKYHFKLVATQVVNLGQTDDTPQVLNLLGAKPQIIDFGLTPGQDSVTVIKAVRAQNADIPMATCAGCALASFVKAVGGPTEMHNVYSFGTPAMLAQVLPHTKANLPTINDINNYYAAMKAAGYGGVDQLNAGIEGWATARELVTAIKDAKSLDENAVKNAAAHERVDALGVTWERTPKNYLHTVADQTVLAVTNPDGTFSGYKPQA